MDMKPIAFDNKSKIKLIEHGLEWIEETNCVKKHDFILLKSIKTGYLKWWPTTHVNYDQCDVTTFVKDTIS
jgi:hypothetical protein